MKNKFGFIKKYRIYMVLSAVLLLFLGGCGSATEATNETVTASKDYIYSQEDLSFDIDLNYVGRTISTADRIYFYLTEYNDTGTTNQIVSFLMDGTDKQVFSIDISENAWVNNYSVDEEGNVYLLIDEYTEDNSDPDNYVYSDTYYLRKFSAAGEVVWEKNLNEYQGDQDYFYVNNMVLGKENILLLCSSGLILLDSEADVITADMSADKSYGNVYLLKDQNAMVSIYGDTGEIYYKFDMTTGTLGQEELEFPVTLYNYTVFQGSVYDLYLADSYGVYGYNFGDESLTTLMNYIDSDLDISYLNSLIAISDTEFLISYYDNITYENQMSKLTKVPADEVKDKILITLGCYYLDYTVKNRVVEFNKSQDEYRISIIDYSTYMTDDDYTAGITKLNTDIVSGNVPDILILNNQLPINSYIEKGIFEDLNPYIDGDEELDRSDYLTNIFDAFSTDGKMYQLVPNFYVMTMAGKTADVGTETGWTLDDLNALLQTKPDDIEIVPDVIRDSMLNYCIQMASSQFINWETGECDFDSQGFIDFLKFIEKFPEEYDYSGDDNDLYWSSYDTMYREGRALLSVSYLASFSDYNYLKKGTFGEDITLIGFPAADKNGSSINYNLNFAMSSKSANKDEVWQFLRYYLTDEYQDTITYGWPISIKKLDELGEEAKEKPYWLDDNGEKVEYDQTYYLDDTEIIIEPSTEEEVEYVKNFIKSLNQPAQYDDELLNIISEEAASYFNGQKSVEEVAAIIQSRVQIYVSENM